MRDLTWNSPDTVDILQVCGGALLGILATIFFWWLYQKW